MIVSIDFETYYSSDYSLSKMSELEYILDPRFQIIGAAVKIDDGPSDWYYGRDAVAARLAEIDWSKAALLCHNTRFDGAILYWNLGIIPALYLDTLSMSRATIHAVTNSSSLHNVAKYLGIGTKGDEVVKAIGKRLEDFHADELRRYGVYCCNDNDLCYAAFKILATRLPKSELRTIDQVLRMFIQPQLRLVEPALEVHLAAVQQERADAFAKVAAIPKTVLSSNQQFAALLEEQGVDVPMKPSPTDPSKSIPALSRSDRGFKELQQDATLSPFVQALLAARISAKSTIEETRTAKLLSFSKVAWPDGERGWLPVPLLYYGAHTGRFSGSGGFNMQNLRRDSKIKQAIVADRGYVIITRDASQIEARMVAWLAQQLDLIQQFANGEDVYSIFASMVFGRKITKADKIERFIGKTCILGLGYGMGPERFRHALFIGSAGISVNLDLAEAARIVQLYRRVYAAIPNLWQTMGYLLHRIVLASSVRNALSTEAFLDMTLRNRLRAIRPGFECIWLPNGMPIAYPKLRIEVDAMGQEQILYTGPYGSSVKLFGGKVAENVSQALARIVITDIIERIWAERKLHPCLQVHDSLAYVVPAAEARDFDAYLDHQFSIRPHWAPDLPLASEGGWGVSLADAEAKLNP